MEYILKVGKRSITYYEGSKALLKGRKPGLFTNLNQFP
jgi:hypothetical protein